MKYTEQEEKELNKQLKMWQNKQLKAAKGNNFDSACEKMHDAELSVWEIVAKAESYKDVSWGVWENAERVIDKYYKLSR